jgi:hypothetical protein
VLIELRRDEMERELRRDVGNELDDEPDERNRGLKSSVVVKKEKKELIEESREEEEQSSDDSSSAASESGGRGGDSVGEEQEEEDEAPDKVALKIELKREIREEMDETNEEIPQTAVNERQNGSLEVAAAENGRGGQEEGPTAAALEQQLEQPEELPAAPKGGATETEAMDAVEEGEKGKYCSSK